MYGFYLIAVLVLVGGLIAYIGDRIGMRVGRRRLTLFGLRPKHTSILITIVTGVLIVAASLAVLSIASNDVRTALFHMRSIQEALATSESRLITLEASLARGEEELERTMAQRDEATRELASADERLQQVEAEYAQVRDELEEAEQDVEFQQGRIINLQQIGEELVRRTEEMQDTVQALENRIDNLTMESMRLRLGEVAFRADEIVLARVIEGGRPAEEIRADLLRLLEEADEAALRRGARYPDRDAPTALQFRREDDFFVAADFMAERDEPAVVRVVAFENTLIGEPVKVDIALVSQRQIYEAGDVIAERVIERPRGGVVEDEILSLLQDVNINAIQEGMITNEGGTVGEFSLAEFLGIVRDIQQRQDPVRVRAVAVQDTVNTAGPLVVRLDLQ